MKYYTCANTSLGFVDFTEDNIFDVGKKIKLVCQNTYVKSYILGFLKGESEKIMSVGSGNLTAGLIFRNENTALVENCKNADKVINLDDYFGFTEPEENRQFYKKMLEAYEQAKEVHDEWEDIYIKNMDFERLGKYCNGVIKSLVVSESNKGKAKTYKRFFGTSTVNGPVNFIDNLTESIDKRYFIKGRPGTGKSTFLKTLSGELKSKNYDVEEYYCSFDSKSLDMVICRELSFCVFDSTAPHEKFPERKNDEVLDFYLNSGLLGVDERYEKELAFAKSAYDSKIKGGMKYFKIITKNCEELYKQNLSQIDVWEMRKIAQTIM